MLQRQIARRLSVPELEEWTTTETKSSVSARHRCGRMAEPENLNGISPVTAVAAVTVDLAAERRNWSHTSLGAPDPNPSEVDGDNGDIGDSKELTQQFRGASLNAASPSPGEGVVTSVTARVAPAAWFSGVARLQMIRPPDGFSGSRWRQLQFDAAALLDEHGDELHRLGWSDLDVFGIHPTEPARGVHCYGLVACLNGGRVMESETNHAVIRRPAGALLTFRRKPMVGAVPVWAYPLLFSRESEKPIPLYIHG